jgi:predicted Ser/Thr protein kinase
MVHAAGVERLNEGTQHEILSYKFFAGELFGIEEPIARIVEYFKSAAQRLEVRKRILFIGYLRANASRGFRQAFVRWRALGRTEANASRRL